MWCGEKGLWGVEIHFNSKSIVSLTAILAIRYKTFSLTFINVTTWPKSINKSIIRSINTSIIRLNITLCGRRWGWETFLLLASLSCVRLMHLRYTMQHNPLQYIGFIYTFKYMCHNGALEQFLLQKATEQYSVHVFTAWFILRKQSIGCYCKW